MTQITVHVVLHDREVPLDRFDEWLRQPGVNVVTHALWDGDDVPDVNVDGVVVMGGRQDAYDDEASPFLPRVRGLLRECVSTGTPVLGVCLGAQLLAAATGGQVNVADARGPEKGYVQVRATDAGLADPVVGPALGAGSPTGAWVPVMHADAVAELPAGAELLATSDTYVHAFRLGSAVAVQFHPEAGPELLASWAHLTGGDPDAMSVQGEIHDVEAAAVGQTLVNKWLESVRADPSASAGP